LSWAMSVKCVLELRRGDLYAAVRFGERALNANAQSASPLTWMARACLAEALLEIGEPHRCRQQLLTGDSAQLRPPFALYEPRYFELLLQAELALGELERADELAEQVVQAAARGLRKLGHVPRVVPTRGLAAGPIPALSSRELQVVERLGAGMTNRQIAEELFLSVRTVDRHTARIYEKLGVNSRAAAASEF